MVNTVSYGMFCKSGKSIIQSAMILAVFCACSRLSAMGSSDRYDSLMQDGSSAEITSALKADSDLITYTVGKDRNTLLMSALSYKRPLSIIKLDRKSTRLNSSHQIIS